MSITAAMLPALLGRSVAYQAVFTRLDGVNVQGAIFLSQALFLTQTPTAAKRGGWFWKEQQGVADSWEAETGMSPKQQVTARRQLTTLGVLEEKRSGVPAKTWYRVDVDRLAQVLAEALDDDQSPSEPHGCPDSPNGRISNPPTGESRSAQPERTDSTEGSFLTETTTENNPSLSDAGDVFERAALLGDDGQPFSVSSYPMSEDWEPDWRPVATLLAGSRMSQEAAETLLVEHGVEALEKFRTKYLAMPGRCYPRRVWHRHFADYLAAWRRNIARQTPQPTQTTGGAHANGHQRDSARRLTPGEARRIYEQQQREQQAQVGDVFDANQRPGHG